MFHMSLIMNENTDPAVIALVSLAVKTAQRVRVWYGEPTTGESWEIEEGTTGVITEGKDGLYLKQRVTSKVGHKVPTECIVRLIIGTTEAYKHPNFKAPCYQTKEEKRYPAAPWWVYDGSHVVKRFTTIIEASRWVDFMSGLRMNLSGRKDGV